MKSRPIVYDPDAASSKTDEPAFIARPEGCPVYHGFMVIEESETEGWRYGAISAFEDAQNEEEGDGFIIAPDGSRAGVAWAIDTPDFYMIMPPDEGRWGVYGVCFPKTVSSRDDLIMNFRAVLPLFKRQYDLIRTNG
jgi:hypothetical protein